MLTSQTNYPGRGPIQINTTLYITGSNDGFNLTPIEKGVILPNDELSGWTIESNQMKEVRVGSIGFSANEYIYAIGGFNYYTIPTTSEKAKINPDSTLGEWSTFNNPPFYVSACSAVTANGYLYAIGGYDVRKDVYRCSLNPDGTLGTWTLCTSQLNVGREGAGVLLINDYLYVASGYLTTSVERANVYSDGELGAFTTISYCVAAHYGPPLVKVGNYLYLIDGYAQGNPDYRVERAQINPDMSLGQWEQGPYLNQQRGASCAQTPTAIYMISGATFGGTLLTSIERALIINSTDIESSQWQFLE